MIASARDRIAAIGIAALVVLLFAAAPASAARPYRAQIGGASGAPFSNPFGLAVDPSDNLWVADASFGGSVFKLTPAGSVEAQSSGAPWAGSYNESLGFSNASNRLYVADSNHDDVWGVNPDASYAGIDLQESPGAEWGNGCCNVHTAADNSGGATDGDLYVSGHNNAVYRIHTSGTLAPFSASGTKPYIEEATLTGAPTGPGGTTVSFVGQPTGLAVGSSGELFVANGTEVDEFESSGIFVRAFTEANGSPLGSIAAVASDPTNGNVLVADATNRAVYEFTALGTYIGQITEAGAPLAPFANPHGLAVNSEGELYIADGEGFVNGENRVGAVDVFGPASPVPPRPKGSYEPVTGIGPNSATLNAEIEPNGGGAISACKFEYGASSASFDHSVSCTPGAPYATATQVSGPLSGLIADTKYHYRLALTNANGTKVGAEQAFETLKAVSGVATTAATDVSRTGATLNGHFTGNGEDTHYYFEWGMTEAYGHEIPVPPADAGSPPLGDQVSESADLAGLSPVTTYHYRFVASNAAGVTPGNDQSFETLPAVENLSADPVSAIAESSAVFHGSYSGQNEDVHFYFEWGTTESYGELTPLPPGADAGTTEGPTPVSLTIEGLRPATTYFYRIVASDGLGSTTSSNQQSFETTAHPAIEGVSAANLTATTAELKAQINPNGSLTEYRFEYGASKAYGHSAPVPDQSVGEGYVAQAVAVQLEELEEGVVYHFRLVAHNTFGTTASEDQTFNFFPPPCPNEVIRQQTASSYLPDCRAYELVSPENAGNVLLFPAGLAAPYATNPARFAFDGGLGAIHGTNPPNSANVDIYLATRTDTGWVTKYSGLRGNEVGGAGDTVGDLGLDKLMDFTAFAFGGVSQPQSNAPYIWDANGNSLGRWPDNVTEIPNGDTTHGGYQPSADFSHLAFSSINIAFTPDGLTQAPGSAYDYSPSTGATTLISRTASGQNIAQEPGNADAQEYIEFPGDSPRNLSNGSSAKSSPTQNASGVSTDGSHILMSTWRTQWEAFTRPAPPQRLYMRVNDLVSYDVSQNHDVVFVGMTSDGTNVYFTSPEQLTAEDHDSSTDLYMWSEAGEKAGAPLRLISKGNNTGGAGEPGNTDECSATWTEQCSVAPIATAFSGGVTGHEASSSGIDNVLAAGNGDIYFYSPELLDGSKGVPGDENLYVYRHNEVQFVAALAPTTGCNPNPEAARCSNGPLVRMQVNPDDSHMVFVTADQVTPYNNAGFQEMYTYAPETGKIVCVSCLPSGAPPTGDVEGSMFGLTMSNDGRAFFYTPDALVAQDTNHLHDVYEFVEGRPQLITSGVGSADAQKTPNQVRPAGLSGVSANGVNVYFATYESLVGQDQNGAFLKFYDARTNGGFPFVPSAAPCAAADECHGLGSSSPTPTSIVSNGAPTRSGNVSGRHKRPRARHRKRHKHKSRNRRSGTHRHGSRHG